MSFAPDFKIGLWNAWLFMSVFVIQMLIIMLSDRRIRAKAHVPSDTKRNKMERYTGAVANIVWLLALIYSVFLPLKTDTAWWYASLGIYIVGFIIFWIATFNFMVTPADRLISTGVYRISRHPMYLATFFICIGTGLAAASWVFILLSLLMAFCFHMEALIEERVCREMYGSDYQIYLKRVPRWIGLVRK